MQIASREGGSMVVLFCKTLPRLWEVFLFLGEINKPMMAICGKAFHSYLYIPIELCLSLKLFSK